MWQRAIDESTDTFDGVRRIYSLREFVEVAKHTVYVDPCMQFSVVQLMPLSVATLPMTLSRGTFLVADPLAWVVLFRTNLHHDFVHETFTSPLVKQLVGDVGLRTKRGQTIFIDPASLRATDGNYVNHTSCGLYVAHVFCSRSPLVRRMKGQLV